MRVLASAVSRSRPVRIVLDPDDRPVAKRNLCSQQAGFNLHGATRVAANDKKGRETLCKYILRPPLANERLKILNDGHVRLEFIVTGTLEGFPSPPAMVRGEQSSPAPHACPWSDGTTSIELEPLAIIARLAALVPPPRRHITRYSGVLSSHSSLRSQIVPAAPELPAEKE